jgi:hypothetical protein
MRDFSQRFFTTQKSTDDHVLIKVGGECDAATPEELHEVLANAPAAHSLLRGGVR